jgi:hypothetical protein
MINLTNWKLTLPIDKAGKNIGTAVEVYKLAGFNHVPYFEQPIDGSLLFATPVDGSTTSGSKYPRSELREMAGTKEAAWTIAKGGIMSADMAVLEVPKLKNGKLGHIVIGQIHGKNDELVRMYYEPETKTVNFHCDISGADGKEHVFKLTDADGKEPSIEIGERFSYRIEAKAKLVTVTVFADGKVYSVKMTPHKKWSTDKFYFKGGVYSGVNETQGTGVAKTVFYALDVTH